MIRVLGLHLSNDTSDLNKTGIVMLFTDFGIVISFRQEQPQKALFPIDSTLPGRSTLVSDEQNASSPISMLFDDITISTKEQQRSNALLPMDTTESGMTTFSNEEQSLKAQEPIFVKFG